MHDLGQPTEDETRALLAPVVKQEPEAIDLYIVCSFTEDMSKLVVRTNICATDTPRALIGIAGEIVRKQASGN